MIRSWKRPGSTPGLLASTMSPIAGTPGSIVTRVWLHSTWHMQKSAIKMQRMIFPYRVQEDK